MPQICKMIMLMCFGISWPISVYKSINSKSTKGKSVIFIMAIIFGCCAGIIDKVLNNQINYTLVFYCLNFCIVSLDLALYFFNKSREKKAEIKT